MHSADLIANALYACGIRVSVGVPDSTLSPLLALFREQPRWQHLTVTNEGEAIAVAAGNYLATQRPALVYMQNSGFGNAINPLASLASRDVRGIPMLLLIGWRAAPGFDDEPQHRLMGRALTQLLSALEIDFAVLPSDDSDAYSRVIQEALVATQAKRAPYALLVKPESWQLPFKPVPKIIPGRPTLHAALRAILSVVPEHARFVATTGATARTLFALRREQQQTHDRDFYMVGSMGYASAIGLGLALALPAQLVIILDGDGSCLMHLGNITSIGAEKPSHLLHILLDNGCHGSTGGQPTNSRHVDFVNIATACGYSNAVAVEDFGHMIPRLDALLAQSGPRFLYLKTSYDPALPPRVFCSR